MVTGRHSNYHQYRFSKHMFMSSSGVTRKLRKSGTSINNIVGRGHNNRQVLIPCRFLYVLFWSDLFSSPTSPMYFCLLQKHNALRHTRQPRTARKLIINQKLLRYNAPFKMLMTTGIKISAVLLYGMMMAKNLLKSPATSLSSLSPIAINLTN